MGIAWEAEGVAADPAAKLDAADMSPAGFEPTAPGLGILRSIASWQEANLVSRPPPAESIVGQTLSPQPPTKNLKAPVFNEIPLDCSAPLSIGRPPAAARSAARGKPCR